MATKAIAPLIVITGPTASGKSSLAMELAQKFNGEIICADSRTIYKGMDIGTAKPSKQDQALVPHWGLDLVEPDEYFSVADFKSYTNLKIDEIRRRGRVPFLVGGTGLYIDSVIFDFQFGSAMNSILRERLNKMDLVELHEYCKNNNVVLPENKNNKRYVIRAIETKDDQPKRLLSPIANSFIAGIATERNILLQRIAKRSEQMFDDGVVNEAKLLGKKYGWKSEAMYSNVYPLVHEYILGKISMDELKERLIIADRQLAKKQMTWLRRNSFVHWASLSDAKILLEHMFAKAK